MPAPQAQAKAQPATPRTAPFPPQLARRLVNWATLSLFCFSDAYPRERGTWQILAMSTNDLSLGFGCRQDSSVGSGQVKFGAVYGHRANKARHGWRLPSVRPETSLQTAHGTCTGGWNLASRALAFIAKPG